MKKQVLKQNHKVEHNLAKNLKQVMSDLFSESKEEIFLKLTKSEIKKSNSLIFIPEFNSDEINPRFKKKKIVNFKRIVYDYKKELEELASYKVATNVLKTKIRKKHSAYDKKIVLELNDVVKKILSDFLISCLGELNFKKPDMKPFEKIYPKLKNYLENELFSVFCFTTLRNFDYQKKSLLLPRDQVLRIRTPEEFSTMCNILDVSVEPVIQPNFQKIKYIIGTHILKTDISEKKIFETFEKFLFALKIFHSGDVQFGGVYYTDSVDWDVKPIICIKSEPILEKPKIKYRLESESFTEKDFKKFIDDFSKINFFKGKYVFLGRAIKRFSQAIENENDLDRIVDFITCLESLYSSNEQELSFRFAMRTAIALGQTSYQKIVIQEFILQIYNLRSKIVHGDVIPPIEIDGKEIVLDTCLKNLEKISRNSIKLFLQLIDDYESKEKLHKSIDNSIYDPIQQKTFSKSFNNLKLPIVNIS